MGVELKAALVRTTAEIETAAAVLPSEPGGALLVAPDTFTLVHRGLIIRSAEEHAFQQPSLIDNSSRKAPL